MTGECTICGSGGATELEVIGNDAVLAADDVASRAALRRCERRGVVHALSGISTSVKFGRDERRAVALGVERRRGERRRREAIGVASRTGTEDRWGVLVSGSACSST